MQKEQIKLNRDLNGIRAMKDLPQAVFVIDPMKEEIAVQEARKLNIPVVAIIDTNCNPDDIDYIIPGNDDAIRAIKLFASKFADAVIEGRKHFEEKLTAESNKETQTTAEAKPAETDIPESVEMENDDVN